MSKLKRRGAVVTGAASGIGREIAIAYPRWGSDVVADKGTEPQAADVIAAIKKHGREALSVSTDVNEKASVRAMAEQALAHFGHVDILVNNRCIAEAQVAR